jgi:polar amino acid transport system substrate-binding protein
MRLRTLLALATALATLLAASACARSTTPATPAANATAPLPDHVLVGEAAEPARSGVYDDSCDPGASFRPPAQLPTPGNMPAGSTMARIQGVGHLTVGVDQNTYLFGYRNPATGQIEGFDIDLARQVAKAIFGDPNRVQFRVITNAQRIPALTSGQVDMVAHSMTMHCDRWRQVAFSTAYLSVGKRLLVRAGSGISGIADLAGRRACAATGSSGVQAIVNASSDPIPVVAPNWTDCLVMLQQNQVDAVVSDTGVLTGLLNQDPGSRIVGPTFEQDLYGLAFNRDQTDLVRFVNGVLERIRADGTWTAEYDRWLLAGFRTPGEPPPLRYRD